MSQTSHEICSILAGTLEKLTKIALGYMIKWSLPWEVMCFGQTKEETLILHTTIWSGGMVAANYVFEISIAALEDQYGEELKRQITNAVFKLTDQSTKKFFRQMSELDHTMGVTHG